jgi:hypothetical protein
MRSTEPIYGEEPDILLSVIADLQYRRCGRDEVRISSHELPESRVAPLVRALMRAEAEVLLEAAEAGGVTYYPETADQGRQAEAFARVFRAVGKAEVARSRDR